MLLLNVVLIFVIVIAMPIDESEPRLQRKTMQTTTLNVFFSTFLDCNLTFSFKFGLALSPFIHGYFHAIRRSLIRDQLLSVFVSLVLHCK